MSLHFPRLWTVAFNVTLNEPADFDNEDILSWHHWILQAGNQLHVKEYAQNIQFCDGPQQTDQWHEHAAQSSQQLYVRWHTGSLCRFHTQHIPGHVFETCKRRTQNQPEKQHSDRKSPKMLLCGTKPLHDSVSSPARNQHMHGSPQSTREADSHYGPLRLLVDGDWRWKPAQRQAEKHPYCGVAVTSGAHT